MSSVECLTFCGNVMSVWSLTDASRTSPLQGHLTVLKVTVTVCHTAEHCGEECDHWCVECKRMEQ